MKKVVLRIHDEYVDGGGVVCGAKGSAKSTTLRVEFTNWDGLSKYATFKNSLGQYETLVVLTLDMEKEENIYELPIPIDAMTEEGMMMVTFTGYNVEGGQIGSLENTATAYLRVLPSEANDFLDDESMHSSLAQQLQAEIDSFEGIFSGELEESHAYADMSKSYAVGGTGTRAGESSDNSKYYSEESARLKDETQNLKTDTFALKNDTLNIYSSLPNGFIPMGTVDFDDLPNLADAEVGWTYNVDDDFTTTSDFKRGSGTSVEAGSFVYKTGDGYWDYLSGDYPSNHVAVAPTFSTSSDYEVGDYVTYDNATYRFWSFKYAGPWDSGKVDPIYGIGQYVTAGKKVNTTLGVNATAEGSDTTASNVCAHAEGSETTAQGGNSHAEGYQTNAQGPNAHAEGSTTTASGNASHTEGYYTTATAWASHAEGKNTTASEKYAHAEGLGATASKDGSHAEGYNTTASGLYSHAEGAQTVASHVDSHAEGCGTITGADDQHVSGKFNEGKSTTLLEIGNGTADDARSNAFEVDTNGNVVAGGSITDGNGNTLSEKANAIIVEKKRINLTYISDSIDVFDVNQVYPSTYGITSILVKTYSSAANVSVAKEGYTPIGIVGYQIVFGDVFLKYLFLSNQNLQCEVCSFEANNSGYIDCYVLYQKNS